MSFRTVPKTLFLLFLCSLTFAQTRKLSPKELPRSAFRLISINVTGNSHYSSPDIIAATGLQVGQTASEDDFKKATQQVYRSREKASKVTVLVLP